MAAFYKVRYLKSYSSSLYSSRRDVYSTGELFLIIKYIPAEGVSIVLVNVGLPYRFSVRPALNGGSPMRAEKFFLRTIRRVHLSNSYKTFRLQIELYSFELFGFFVSKLCS